MALSLDNRHFSAVHPVQAGLGGEGLEGKAEDGQHQPAVGKTTRFSKPVDTRHSPATGGTDQ